MDEKVVKMFANEIPIEIRNAVKALSDDRRWAVFIALMKEGRMSFNELKNLFNAHPETLNRILKSLKAGGLIRQFVVSFEDLGNRKRSYSLYTLVSPS